MSKSRKQFKESPEERVNRIASHKRKEFLRAPSVDDLIDEIKMFDASSYEDFLDFEKGI